MQISAFRTDLSFLFELDSKIWLVFRLIKTVGVALQGQKQTAESDEKTLWKLVFGVAVPCLFEAGTEKEK